MIVDARPDTRQLLVKLLHPFGFELREAENGQEALDIWSRWEPHLIWMDLRMPVMDGYQATHCIKSSSKGAQTIVIVMSASVIDDDRISVITAGCDDFLRKPFHENEIFDLLHKHLGVRFVYEDVEGYKARGEGQMVEDMLTAEALTALSEKVRRELHQAVENLDVTATHHSIERIRQQNVTLAEALADLVNGYRFDMLQKFLEKSEHSA